MTTRRNFIKGILSGMPGAFLSLAGSLRVGKEPYCPEATTPSPAESEMASLRRAEQFWEERAWYWMNRSDEWRQSALEQQEDALAYRQLSAQILDQIDELREEVVGGLLRELEERDKHLVWFDIRLEAALIDPEIVKAKAATLQEGIDIYRQCTGYEPNILIDKGA